MNKKLITLFFVCLFAFFGVATSAHAFTGPGTGTPLDPYLIFNCVQLGEMAEANDLTAKNYHATTILQRAKSVTGEPFPELSVEGFAKAVADDSLSRRQKVRISLLEDPGTYSDQERPEDIALCLIKAPEIWASLEEFMRSVNKDWPILVERIIESHAEDTDAMQIIEAMHDQFEELIESLRH